MEPAGRTRENRVNGMKDSLQIAADGEALAPVKPGLGYVGDEGLLVDLSLKSSDNV